MEAAYVDTSNGTLTGLSSTCSLSLPQEGGLAALRLTKEASEQLKV